MYTVTVPPGVDLTLRKPFVKTQKKSFKFLWNLNLNIIIISQGVYMLWSNLRCHFKALESSRAIMLKEFTSMGHEEVKSDA